MPPETKTFSLDYDTHTKASATSGSYQVTLNTDAQHTLRELLADTIPGAADAEATCTVHATPWRITCAG